MTKPDGAVAEYVCLNCGATFSRLRRSVARRQEREGRIGPFCSPACSGRWRTKHTPIPHGTPGGYSNRLCRCDACRKAWADYQQARGYRHKAREGK